MSQTTVPDQFAEFRIISDRMWQVPTGIEGQHRFLQVVRQWWQSDPKAVVLVVDAANTFRRLDGGATHGDHACYIGCPPAEIGRDLESDAAAYRRALWVVRNGNKLTEREVQGFSVPSTALDDIELDYRP